MTIESPHLSEPVLATYTNFAELVPRLVGVEDPYAIVSDGEDQTYAQVLWVGDGFLFEYRAGGSDQHFRSTREDLSEAETIDALNAYAAGRPIWALGIEFQHADVRTPSQRAGRFVGELLRPFVQLYRSIR